MRKPDEIAFFAALRKLQPPGTSPAGRDWIASDVAAELGLNENRYHFLLDKWTDNGWWEYGVSLRTGWFTDDAPAELLP